MSCCKKLDIRNAGFTLVTVLLLSIRKQMLDCAIKSLSGSELTVPFLLLYAETHFRFFRFFPSLLFKREPEVIFDLPGRIEPGCALPVMLIINDIRHYPDYPERVAIAVSFRAEGTEVFTFDDPATTEVVHALQDNQRVFLFEIPESRIPAGEFFVTATVTMKNPKRTYTVLNDNLNTSTKRAFRCYKSSDSLPGKGLCSYGDLHMHSQFSQSHVEFGPPIEVIDKMATCCGLSFIGITDHSYDLACDKGDFLKENQSIERWNLLARQLNDTTNFSTIVILGEEISCYNGKGKTVHLGALGIRDFLPGSSDGARRNPFFKQSFTIREAIEAIHGQGGIAFAAHPGSRSGLLQSLFLNRGQWDSEDLKSDLDALQSFNGSFLQAWKRAKALWLNMLAENRPLPLLAGNDAHGDFNRYRAIKTPFLSIYDNFQRFMGYGKTGIYGSCTTAAEVVRKVRNGETFISTGPYISINYSEKYDDFAVGNHLRTAEREKLYVHCVTTREFGGLESLSVFSGKPGTTEKLIYSTGFAPDTRKVNAPVTIPYSTAGLYLRAEVISRDVNGQIYQAYTSPCLL